VYVQTKPETLLMDLMKFIFEVKKQSIRKIILLQIKKFCWS